MIKHPAQRVAVLVDAQNMYHSAKHLFGARLNFGKAVQDAVAGRPLVRAIAYVAKSKTGEEASFFEALIEAKIEPRIKDVQEFSSGAKKADWDVGMAIDAVKLAEKVDVIVLMTGDGDFCPVIEYLHGHGVMVEVVAFGESTNAELRAMADSFVDLSASRANLLRAGSKKAQPDIEPSETSSDAGSTRGARSVKVTY
ncbi:MAG: NYN domain-containing protein [Patescibacteria group bacterium]